MLTEQRLEPPRTAPQPMIAREPEHHPRGRSPGRDPRARSTDSQGRARPLVLLAEDDLHDGEIYGKTLWYNGFDVLHGADGEAALDLARRHTPDLVLVDLLLPKMNGIELCRHLREEPAIADVPIIALTARSEREYGLLARDAGCSDYLEKPIGPLAVLAAVEKAIGRAPLPGEEVPDEARPTGDPPRHH